MDKVTSGTICIKNRDLEYIICKIEYIYYNDENFKYIFTPFWNVIDMLPTELYQGIPGLNMDLHKEKYERENIIPVFISERAPAKNREDLWDLLQECDMDYLNQLEWLIRTDRQYFGDEMYVKRFVEGKRVNQFNDLVSLNYQDGIKVDSIFDLSQNEKTLIKLLLKIVIAGATLEAKEMSINDTNRKAYFDLLFAMYSKMFDDEIIKQRGRPKDYVDVVELADYYDKFLHGRMTQKQIMEKMNISSRSTYYRRLKECEKIGLIDKTKYTKV